MAPSSMTKVCLMLAFIASASFAKSPVSFVDAVGKKEAAVNDGAIEDAPAVAAKNDASPVLRADAIVKDEYRLPSNVTPVHYDLELEVDLEQFTFNGMVTIQIKTESNGSEVQFHAYENIKLNNVVLRKAERKEEIVVESRKYNNNTDIWTIRLKELLVEKNNYVLQIPFESPLPDDTAGFYKDSYLTKNGSRSWYAVTHFEPVGARRAFPCFDEPALKATFSVKITHDKKYKAISNTEVEDTTDVNGKTKTSFKKTPQMSTYLVAYAVTDFASKANTTEKMAVWTRSEVVNMTTFAVDTGVKVLKELAKFTGVPYKLAKMDQIGLPLLSPGAMENWGLVTYRESYLLYDEKVNATSSLQRAASIISHEFAHQWFGNLVSPKWWKFLWLNEGFATYFEYYITDKIYPEYRIWDQFTVTALQGRAFGVDVTEKTRPMNYIRSSNQTDIKALFDGIAYQKAGSVIRMFSHVLGEENFKLALNRYLTKMQLSAAMSDDLFDAFENVAVEKKLQLPKRVHDLADKWVNEVGFPVISVKRDSTTGKIEVRQSRFFLDTPPANASKPKWWVPLSYTTEKKANFAKTAPTIWLSPEQESLQIEESDKDGWVLFNIQQTGYYRVQYDENNWKALAKFLKEGEFTTIHSLNRAQLIDDALNLARAGLLNYSLALDVIAYLEKETDYIAMLAAFNGFSYLNKMLLTTSTYRGFQEFVARIAENLLKSVSLEEKKEDSYVTKLNRIQAMKWACDFGSKLCREHAMGKLKNWLKAPFSGTGFSANLKKVTLCGAMRISTEEVWTNVLVTYALNRDANEKEVILSALGCSLNSTILENFLDLASQPDSIFARPRAVFQSVYTSSDIGAKVALDYIVKNVEIIKTHDKSAADNLVSYVNDIATMLVSKDDVDKLEAFATKQKLPNDRVKEALQNARKNVEWYNKNSKIVAEWIESTNKAAQAAANTSNDKGSATSSAIAGILLLLPALVVRIN